MLLPGDKIRVDMSSLQSWMKRKLPSYSTSGLLAPNLTLSVPNFKRATLNGISSIKYYQVPYGGFTGPPCLHLSVSISQHILPSQGQDWNQIRTHFEEALTLRCLTLIQTPLHFAYTQATLGCLLLPNPITLCGLLPLCLSPLFAWSSLLSQLFLCSGNTFILLGSAQMLGSVWSPSDTLTFTLCPSVESNSSVLYTYRVFYFLLF